VDLLDTSGQYHTVWSGTDPTNSMAEAVLTLGSAPGAVPFNQVSWTTSPYLVVGVRIYTTNYHAPGAQVSNVPDIDAVQLSGSYDPTANGSVPLSRSNDPAVNRGRSDQYATSVLSQGVSGSQYAVGFAIPVYADGVTIPEPGGNGFVTGVDILPMGADPVSGWVSVWSGTQPTPSGAPAAFTVYWPETSYLVGAVRIDVSNANSLVGYDGIGGIQLHGWFSQGTVVASGTGASLTFTTNSGPNDTNVTYVATLTATDGLGNVAMTQAVIDVAPAVPPTAHIINPSYSGGEVGLTLTATDPTPGDQAASFTIDWGDGSGVQPVPASNGSAMPLHVYAAAGTYLVTVTATDTAGMTSAIATAVVIVGSPDGGPFFLSGGSSPGQVTVTTPGAGALPAAGLVMDGNGNLYGTTSAGGPFNDGTVFELPYNTSTQTYGTATTLASFDGADGADPLAALILHNGDLYGTTSGGGAFSDGTVFELALGTDALATPASFDGTDGANPAAALIMDNSGNLYSTTSNGGAFNQGTVFELPYNSSTQTYGTIVTLATFNDSNGSSPVAGLIMDSSGNLYGTNIRTVFEVPYNRSAQTYTAITTLASFNASGGVGPSAALVMDSGGNLYGTTVAGAPTYTGTVFELPAGSGAITTLATFSGGRGGQWPASALIMDNNGNLYGTTQGGGAPYGGTVFELGLPSDTLTTLASFNGSDGADPVAPVIMDSGGNVYGTTEYGGASNDGTVFELAHGSGTITTLASFRGAGTATYSPTDLVFVAGQAPNDTYTVNLGPTLTTPIDIAGAGGSLTANGADGDNYFDKVLGTPNQLSWAPSAVPAPAVETVSFTGTSTQILVGGSGSNYFIDPGSGTTLVSGPAANTFVITSTAGTGVTIDGGPSTDNFIIDLGSLAGPVAIQNGNPGAADSMTVVGASGNNTITLSGDQLTAGTQTVTFDQPLTDLTIDGGSGNNQVTVSNLAVPVQTLDLNGGGGANTFTLTNIGTEVANLAITPGASGPGATTVQVQGSLPAAVTGIPATIGVAGPATAIPGQPLTFTLTAASPSAAENAAGFGYTVNWGDGTPTTVVPQTANNGGGLTVSHTYAANGSYNVQVTANDGPAVGSASQAVTVASGIYILNGTASGALSLSGNAGISLTGSLVVDSNSKTALTESGNASVKATAIQVVGGVSKSGNATWSPVPVTGAASVPDPLAALAAPTGGTSQGSVNLSGNKSLTINPGIYTQISVSGSAKLTLNPGIYVLAGGGLTVSGNASISGTCVTLYNTESAFPNPGGTYGGVTLSGNGTFNLTAPTSGTDAGVVVFQARTNTRAIALSGNAAAGLGGTVYAPAALLYLSGNANLSGSVVVNELSLTGNAASAQAVDGSDVSGGDAAGQLLAGNLEVYVDNANGLFTADELARIQDAVNAVNAAVQPFGVSVAETTDPTLANVMIDTGSTSAAGGYADGILGCYSTTGEITLIQGWNWYAGSDPTQIGASQYDFQTTVTHELGHALGLGESGDPTSAMYGTLAPGTAIRTLITADLNIPYDEGAAAPQRAAPVPATAAGASPAVAQEVVQSGPVLPGIPANPPKVAAPLRQADPMIPETARLGEAAGLARVAPARLPAVSLPVGRNVQTAPAAVVVRDEPLLVAAAGTPGADTGADASVAAVAAVRDAFFQAAPSGYRERMRGCGRRYCRCGGRPRGAGPGARTRRRPGCRGGSRPGRGGPGCRGSGPVRPARRHLGSPERGGRSAPATPAEGGA
jgi:uncharacterized repeat protein (TIGR03803 family)